jgi:hypothetical protein
MRKIAVLIVVCTLVLGVLPASTAAAAPIADLAALARYFPDTAPLFIATRTDDGFIESLDGLLAQVAVHIPDAMPRGFSLSAALDQTAGQISGGAGDFETVFRPWLGDFAAIGLPAMADLTETSAGIGPILIAVSITDAAALETWLTDLFDRMGQDVERTEGDGYVVLDLAVRARQRQHLYFLIRDNVLLIANDMERMPVAGAASLAEAERFTEVMGLLPADDYNIAAYLDVQAFGRYSLEMSAAMQPDMPDMSAWMDLAGVQAWGFTLLNGEALTMDLVQTPGDLSALEDMGIPVGAAMQSVPVDLGFAAHVPADAPLVILGTDLGPGALAGLESLQAMLPILEEQMQAMPNGEEALEEMNIEGALNLLRMTFTGFTGLQLEDVLAWMDGNFALYARMIEPENAIPGLPMTFDLAAVIETSDPAGTQALMDGLENGLDRYNQNFSREQVGSADVIVLPDLIENLMENLPATADAPELDLVIGANDTVFVAGTRAAATYSLAPDGDSLAQNPAVLAAQAYLLPDTVQMWYADLGALADLIETLAPREQETAMALRLFSTATISSTTAGDGTSMARFVITLAE